MRKSMLCVKLEGDRMKWAEGSGVLPKETSFGVKVRVLPETEQEISLACQQPTGLSGTCLSNLLKQTQKRSP